MKPSPAPFDLLQDHFAFRTDQKSVSRASTDLHEQLVGVPTLNVATVTLTLRDFGPSSVAPTAIFASETLTYVLLTSPSVASARQHPRSPQHSKNMDIHTPCDMKWVFEGRYPTGACRLHWSVPVQLSPQKRAVPSSTTCRNGYCHRDNSLRKTSPSGARDLQSGF